VWLTTHKVKVLQGWIYLKVLTKVYLQVAKKVWLTTHTVKLSVRVAPWSPLLPFCEISAWSTRRTG